MLLVNNSEVELSERRENALRREISRFQLQLKTEQELELRSEKFAIL